MHRVNRVGIVVLGIAAAGAAALYACQADRTISTEIVIMQPPRSAPVHARDLPAAHPSRER